jgi:hypothetical protein
VPEAIDPRQAEWLPKRGKLGALLRQSKLFDIF